MADFPLILPRNKLIKPKLGSTLIKEAPLADGLVGYWPLNEGTGNLVNDLSGNGSNGVLTGDTTWQAPDVGPAVHFEGNADYINLSGAASPLADWTFVLWVKPTANDDIFLDWGYNWVGKTGVGLLGLAGKWCAVVGNGVAQSLTLSDAAIVTGEWRCVVVTRRGSTVNLYLGGVLQADSDTLAGDISYGAYRTLSYYSSTGLVGEISGAMVYNRALSPSEIARLYADPYQLLQEPGRLVIVSSGAGGTAYVRTINDGVGTTDALGGVGVTLRNIAESLGITDSMVSLKAMLQVLSESLGITDSSITSIGKVRSIEDIVGLVDSFSVLSAFTRLLSENVGLTDAVDKLSAFNRTTDDGVDVTDESSKLSEFNRTTDDGVDVTDESSKLSEFNRTTDDGVGVVDANTDSVGFNRTTDDGVDVTDAETDSAGFNRTEADNLGMTDSVDRVGAFIRVLTDNEGLSDSMSHISVTLRVLAESLGITDLVTHEIGGMVRVIGDSIGLTETILGTSNTYRQLSESVGLADTVSRLLVLSRLLTDNLGITDDMVRGQVRIIADSLGITDDVAALTAYLRTLSDDVGVVDALTRVSVIMRVLDDGVGVEDTMSSQLGDLIRGVFAFLLLKKR